MKCASQCSFQLPHVVDLRHAGAQDGADAEPESSSESEGSSDSDDDSAVSPSGEGASSHANGDTASASAPGIWLSLILRRTYSDQPLMLSELACLAVPLQFQVTLFLGDFPHGSRDSASLDMQVTRKGQSQRHSRSVRPPLRRSSTVRRTR